MTYVKGLGSPHIRASPVLKEWIHPNSYLFANISSTFKYSDLLDELYSVWLYVSLTFCLKYPKKITLLAMSEPPKKKQDKDKLASRIFFCQQANLLSVAASFLPLTSLQLFTTCEKFIVKQVFK